jgi:molybdate/tungstate transport system substrate-binding protein
MSDILTSTNCASIHVLHAGNISALMKTLTEEFQRQNEGVNVTREKGGSVELVKKASTQNAYADVVAIADYHNIHDFLYGKYADWYGEFATTSMVLAYTANSRYSNTITSDNWHQILSTPGVRIMGGDPDVDPGVYRRIMIEKLAEKFYELPGLAKKIESNVLAPEKGSHAIPLAKSGQIDYMFMYKPAVIAHGLKYLELPQQVNLSDGHYKDLYQSVDVLSSGVRVKGDVITYGITTLKNSMHPDLALSFVALLLSPVGTKVIEDNGFITVKPFKAIGSIPPVLKKFC